MRGERRSTAMEVVLWWDEEEEEEDVVVVREDEAGWKCWKHPSQPRYGVCPICLRDRLLHLCPDCAHARPCGCFPSSSSSSSSFSSTEIARAGGGVGRRVGGDAVVPVSRLAESEPRGGDRAGIGAVGPVSRLIEGEPAFRRSRSVGFPLLRSRSTASAASAVGEVEPPSRLGGGKGWSQFWQFWRAPGRKEPAEAKLYRSRSVVEERSPGSGCGDVEGRGKGRRWYFQSPIKVIFRNRKSTTKVVQERSPLWCG